MNYLIQLGMSPEQIERYLSQGYTLEEIIKGVLGGETYCHHRRDWFVQRCGRIGKQQSERM